MAQKESAGVAVKTKGVKEKEEEVPMEEKKEEETENEEDENEDDEESVSDDPDRLWCICRKPHNDRSANLFPNTHSLCVLRKSNCYCSLP